MLVSNEIFPPLAELYHFYIVSADKNKFCVENKRKIKVLTDSLWEQTIETLFSSKPRNHTDARRIINENKNKLTLSDDLDVINALLEVLGQYEILTVNEYIDTSEEVQPFFIISLRKLCITLTSHKNHKTVENATKLRNILNKI